MLYFDKAKMLTYQHTPTFLEGGMRFKVQKSFSIEGELYLPENTSDIGQMLSKQEILLAAAQDNQDILINNINFGRGRITNVNFDSGNLIKENRYTYSIVCTVEGDFSEFTQNEFLGIDWASLRMECVERVDEDFSYNLNEAKDAKYEHNVSVKFNRDVQDLETNPIDLAKALANAFYTFCNLDGFLGQYSTYYAYNVDYYGTPACVVRKFYTETYNSIDFTCSFAERGEIPNEEFCNYSFTYTHNIQTNEKGITTITENGKIQALANPVSFNSWEGFQAQTGNAFEMFSRVNEAYTAYSTNGLTLNPLIMSKSITQDKFNGTVEYVFSYTDNPNVQDNVIWNYTIEINRSIEGYYDITESGSVLAFGRPLTPAKLAAAKLFYANSVAPTISSRIAIAYANAGGMRGPCKVIKQGFGDTPYLGQITYTQVWTDNDLFTDSLIRKQEIEVVTEYPTQITVNYNVFNVGQLIQPQNNSTLGKRNITIRLRGIRGTDIDTYTAFAKGLIIANGYSSIGSDTYISGAKINISPNTNQFSLTVNLTFHGYYKAFDDLTLT